MFFVQTRNVRNLLAHTECCRAPKNGYRSRPTSESTTEALPCQILPNFAYVVKNLSTNQNSTLYLIKNSTIFLRIAAVVSAEEGREPLESR